MLETLFHVFYKHLGYRLFSSYFLISAIKFIKPFDLFHELPTNISYIVKEQNEQEYCLRIW